MSGAKRYMHISPLCEAAPLLMANYPMATEYVLASDYDRDTQALKAEIERYIQEGIRIADQRDALRAQVEEMRAALEVVAEWRLPETGQRWASGEPMSYGACYGSNGERDFMRYLATEALQANP